MYDNKKLCFRCIIAHHHVSFTFDTTIFLGGYDTTLFVGGCVYEILRRVFHFPGTDRHMWVVCCLIHVNAPENKAAVESCKVKTCV